MNSLTEIIDAVHMLARSKGWHDDKLTNEEFLSQQLNNLHAEASELWEAFRAGTLYEPCDKADKMREAGIDPLTCIEEEYADIVIRVFDQCRRLGVDIERAIVAKHAFNATRPYRHGGKRA